MKFGIVALSLGVILVAPIVVSPAALVGDATAQQAMSARLFVQDGGSVHPPVEQPSVLRAPTKPATAVPSEAGRADPSVERPLEVSVTCGKDGCVVTNGLEVTVLESSH